jgi:hypothetical protein
MATICYFLSCVIMKALILAAPIIVLFLATTNAYAKELSFDPSTGKLYDQFDLRLPAALVEIASGAAALLIVNERKKVKGIWFSDSRRLK